MTTQLFLHIGRGKAGSATIQTLASDHSAFMEAAGVFCPLNVKRQANHGGLADALVKPQSDPATVKKFRDDLARADGRKVFISGEALERLKNDGLQRLKKKTRSCDLTILFYIRAYPDWLTSLYAQRTKRARSDKDFDAFFQESRGTVSALPHLERWAAVFGWEALRIRPLDPTILVGGDLIADVLHVLGVDAPPPPVSATNLSPHWIVLECQRALAAAGRGTLINRSRTLSRRLFETCTDGIQPTRVQYLTRAQWHDLAELYRSDLAILSERTGISFPVSLREPAERPFLPSVAAIPADVKAAIRSRARESKFAARLGPETMTLIERMLSTAPERAAGEDRHTSAAAAEAGPP